MVLVGGLWVDSVWRGTAGTVRGTLPQEHHCQHWLQLQLLRPRPVQRSEGRAVSGEEEKKIILPTNNN